MSPGPNPLTKGNEAGSDLRISVVLFKYTTYKHTRINIIPPTSFVDSEIHLILWHGRSLCHAMLPKRKEITQYGNNEKHKK